MDTQPGTVLPVPPTAVRGIPPLAGLCTFAEAQRCEWSVEECVSALKRLHYLFRRLHEVLTQRITSEPQFELKTAFSLHAYLCAEHVQALRGRVSEMREPPLGLDVVPNAALQLLGDELRQAPTTLDFVAGIYEVVVPALQAGIAEYLGRTNRLTDAPSARILRFASLELGDLKKFGAETLAALRAAEPTSDSRPFTETLAACLSAAGGPLGLQPETPCPAPKHSVQPYVYDRVPKRDSRFQDSYNAGVNPEAFIYDERFQPRDKLLMMLYKRLREIDVPEMMASILSETSGKPWAFTLDMSRQLWDEARHSLMGEVGFVSLGLDWTQIPVNFTWSLNLNTQLSPQERHAVLFFIVQGLMPRTGTRYEWEVARESGVPLAGVIQDFDWADEVLHAQLGRRWYVSEFKDLKEALAYGDACWSRVMSHWQSYRDQGLTGHRNWWPEFYATACAKQGIEPDPAALAFNTTYAAVRADLKEIAV